MTCTVTILSKAKCQYKKQQKLRKNKKNQRGADIPKKLRRLYLQFLPHFIKCGYQHNCSSSTLRQYSGVLWGGRPPSGTLW